jgi:hypothetical protein
VSELPVTVATRHMDYLSPVMANCSIPSSKSL